MNYKFSKELILRNFPTKESVLFNLNIGVELAAVKDSLKDNDRLDFLCDCHTALERKDIKKAADLARRAGYALMAEAITLHWGINE